MTHNPDKVHAGDTGIKPWMVRMNALLGASVIAALIHLGQKVFIQLVSVNYHRKQFEERIKENKRNVQLLSQLYEQSRRMFPEYAEFAAEDYIIHQGVAGSLLKPGMASNKSAPMQQLVGSLNVMGNKVTSVFGNVAREVTGANIFNPDSAYSVVLDALHKKDSAEALAQRIWMSMVVEDRDVLSMEDVVEVMGAENEELGRECFGMLDQDENGDVSLEEAITLVTYLHTERRHIAKSMRDVVSFGRARNVGDRILLLTCEKDNAIGVLDSVLSTVAFIVIVFVFVSLLLDPALL